MAWLQNLAGRAEDLLNKIDKNAATVLSEGNTNLLENVEVQKDDLNKEVFVENGQYKPLVKAKGSNTSLNLLENSLQGSPTKEILNEPYNLQPNNDITLCNVITEKHGSSRNGSATEEIVQEKSLKGDQMSTSTSSLHNSFNVTQELEVLQEKLARVELDNQDLNKQLLNMQHLYSELRNENANLQFQVERSNEQLALAQKEKEQYVARAQRILQEKEKLIELKQEQSSNDETDNNIFATYNEELKKELEFQQEKNQELTEKINKLMSDMHSLQTQHQIIQNGLHQSNQSLEQSLLTEKKIKTLAEEECHQKSKELQNVTQELNQAKEAVKIRDSEILNLNEALKQKGSSNVNEDMDSRIKSLTQTLMVKQNTLERVTTERNALRLQIEKLETEYRNNLAQIKRDQVKVINVQDVSDDRIPVPQFMRVSPLDAGVTRKVKHAYSTLDAISVRTGIFLRRYPVARVFVFSYMVILHIWVLFVLFLYAPSTR